MLPRPSPAETFPLPLWRNFFFFLSISKCPLTLGSLSIRVLFHAAAQGELRPSCPRYSVEDRAGILRDRKQESLPHSGRHVGQKGTGRLNKQMVFPIYCRPSAPLNKGPRDEGLLFHCAVRGSMSAVLQTLCAKARPSFAFCLFHHGFECLTAAEITSSPHSSTQLGSDN